MKNAGARNLLRRAIKALKARKLARFALFRDDRGDMFFPERPSQGKDVARCCALGAMAIATGDCVWPGKHKHWNAAIYIMQPVTGNIGCFNDEPGRTKEEVIAAFREAIRRSREDERTN